VALLCYYIELEYIDFVLSQSLRIKSEEYYVNMANAWLLCECLIKEREKTLKFLEHHSLNLFTLNKMISKCSDSFRVSEEDKNLLLKYKSKTN
jgi:3-methyladenine DNA glycosylase AlkD